MNNKLRQASQSLELKQALQSVLAKQEGVKLAILFGSLASGTARAESDLDVAVDAGHPLDAAEKMQLIGDLAAATGRPIDLVDLQSVGEPLLGQILRYGKRLIGNDTSYGDLIRKHLFEQADFMPYRNRILADRRKAWIGK